MDEVQRDKQMHAAALLAGKKIADKGTAEEDRDAALEARIKAVAGGNPGLQEILARPLLADEAEAAEKARPGGRGLSRHRCGADRGQRGGRVLPARLARKLSATC